MKLCTACVSAHCLSSLMSGQLKVAAAVVGTLLGVKLLRHRRYASSAPVTATGGNLRQTPTEADMY